jgi:hypothetical protein
MKTSSVPQANLPKLPDMNSCGNEISLLVAFEWEITRSTVKDKQLRGLSSEKDSSFIVQGPQLLCRSSNGPVVQKISSHSIQA